MRPLKDIPINHFQLTLLTTTSQKESIDKVIQGEIYCGHCPGICRQGVEVEQIYLTKLNDIRIEGYCNICLGRVGRVLELGQYKSFSGRATAFRKAIKVRKEEYEG